MNSEDRIVNPLRGWRMGNKLRQREVAWLMNVTERSVAAYELGAFEPSDEHYKSLAQIMKIDPDDLRMRWMAWQADRKKGVRV